MDQRGDKNEGLEVLRFSTPYPLNVLILNEGIDAQRVVLGGKSRFIVWGEDDFIQEWEISEEELLKFLALTNDRGFFYESNKGALLITAEPFLMARVLMRFIEYLIERRYGKE